MPNPKHDVEYFIGLAQQHGEDSEPDHEVGDLQTFFREAWALLSEAQRAVFRERAAVRETVSAAAGDVEEESADVVAVSGERTEMPDGGENDLIRVCVVLEGGVVQSVLANTTVLVDIIDYDVEDEPDAVLLEQDSGDMAECLLTEFTAEINPKWFPRIDSAQAVDQDADDQRPSP